MKKEEKGEGKEDEWGREGGGGGGEERGEKAEGGILLIYSMNPALPWYQRQTKTPLEKKLQSKISYEYWFKNP